MSTENIVLVTCGTCEAEFEVEFDPPDEPALKGRIEVIRGPRAEASDPVPEE
jgi:hypothetical protein